MKKKQPRYPFAVFLFFLMCPCSLVFAEGIDPYKNDNNGNHSDKFLFPNPNGSGPSQPGHPQLPNQNQPQPQPPPSNLHCTYTEQPILITSTQTCPKTCFARATCTEDGHPNPTESYVVCHAQGSNCPDATSCGNDQSLQTTPAENYQGNHQGSHQGNNY